MMSRPAVACTRYSILRLLLLRHMGHQSAAPAHTTSEWGLVMCKRYFMALSRWNSWYVGRLAEAVAERTAPPILPAHNEVSHCNI